MGGKSKAPAPDPRMGEAANRQIDLAENQWENYVTVEQPWMRGIVDRSIATYEDSTRRANELNDFQLGDARRQNERFWGVTVPQQDRLDADIERLYSQAAIDNQSADAMADVSGAASNARAQGLRAMQRMGVNPMSAAFSENNNTLTVQQASAMASAAKKTRMAAEQAGLASKFQSLGAKLGVAGLGNASAGLAINAAELGQRGAAGATGAAGQMIGATNTSFGSAMSGMSAGVQGLGQYGQLQQNAVKINNDNSPWGAILGAGAKLGSAAIGKWG